MSINEDLSGILGFVSIACWIVVYSPQILTNYKLKSGEGLSLTFVLVWLLGDLCNFGGALMAKLLPTVIILGAYYTVCDLILLFQIYYYRGRNPSARGDLGPSYGAAEEGENAPLLASGPPPEFGEPKASAVWQGVKYAAALLSVFVAGVVMWFVDDLLHGDSPRSPPTDVLEWRSQVIGWISAALYLGSRIPQIRKNFETRCEGLSPAMFLFSITGNTTYTLSILAASLDRRYLIANASWLAGSAGTVSLDVFVLCQFFYYRSGGGSRVYSRVDE